MSRILRFVAIMLAALLSFAALPGTAGAQRHPEQQASAPTQTGPAVRPATHPPRPAAEQRVYLGGYYDPWWGPYPWWPHAWYPQWYYPIYDDRAYVRFSIDPEPAEEAAVYVDGHYAGVADDFNSWYEGLPLEPGRHEIVLYLEGYRTLRRNVHLGVASSFTLRADMERLPAGERSETVEAVSQSVEPRETSYRQRRSTSRLTTSQLTREPTAAGFGTLELWVQPATAEVIVDGRRWAPTEAGRFVIHVAAGTHRIEVSAPGFRSFNSDVEIVEDAARPLNVSLVTTR
jgi:hypothetical protein